MVCVAAALLLLAASIFVYRRFPPREKPKKRLIFRAVSCYFLASLSVLLAFIWFKVPVQHAGVAFDESVIFLIGLPGWGLLIATAIGLQALFVWVHRLLTEAELSGLSGRLRIGALFTGIAAALPPALWCKVDIPLFVVALILLGFLGLFDLFIERRVLNLTWVAVWVAVLAAGAAYGITTYGMHKESAEEKSHAERLARIKRASVEEELLEFSRLVAGDDTLISLLSTPVPFTVQEEVLRREFARFWVRLPFLKEFFYLDELMLVNPQLRQPVMEGQGYDAAAHLLFERDSLHGGRPVFATDTTGMRFALCLPGAGTFSGNLGLVTIRPAPFSRIGTELRFFRAVSLFSAMFLLLIGLTSLWAFAWGRFVAVPSAAVFPFFEKPSLRNRIQLLLAGFTLGSFLLIGLVSYIFFRRSGIIGQEALYEYLAALLNLYVFLLLIALAVAVAAGNSITRPLLVIGEKLQGLRLGRNEPLEWSGQDEIGELVAAYNRMIAEVEKSAELLRRSEREGAWREMAKQVAHEIKNPLTPMKLSIQHLQRAYQSDPEQAAPLIRNVSETLIEQIDTLTRIAGEFSHFAQMPLPQKETFDCSEVIRAVARLFQLEQLQQKAGISLLLPEYPVYLNADRSQITRVLNNLLKNAFQSIPEDRRGRVEVRLETSGNKALLSVHDNGAGIPEEVQSKVFSPNFTTKTSGMGLGLAMCRDIIEASGGRIWFETRVGEGTGFFVEMPVVILDQ